MKLRTAILLTALGLAAPLAARAGGPVEAGTGMARIVDGPALRSAFLHAHEGEVEVAFDLAEDGRIVAPAIVRSTPPGIFDRAALSMLAGMKVPHPNYYPADSSHRHHLVLHFQDDGGPAASITSHH